MNFENVISWFDNSNFMLALAIIIGNVGSKYLGHELDDELDATFDNYLFRKVIVFALVFSGTRNLMLSLSAVLIYMALVTWCKI